MKAALIILTLTSFLSFDTANYDYRKAFGTDYTWAVKWLQQHETEIIKYSSAFHIPAKELKAIIFPELIRYNGLMNTLQIESLKYLYVSEGKQYADFSVGYFQMKPSFAESVERDAMKVVERSLLQETGWTKLTVLPDHQQSRRDRVRRLASIREQIIYLCMFYKICEARFSESKFTSQLDRLRFFATCYNAGYQRSYESVLRYQSKNQFLGYNYSSVSAYYYLNERE